MNIEKAKITKDNTLIATYKDEKGTTTVEGKNLVTNDLVNAFKALIPHLAFLCELKEADGKELLEDMPENIESIVDVSGYSIGGDGDSRGVTLTGKRFLKSNKVLNLNAPFTKFTDESENYRFQFELEQAIEACDYEVNEYLFNKKWKVVQQELPFEDEPVTDVVADQVPEVDIPAPEGDFPESNQEKEAFTKMLNVSSSKRRSRKTKTANLAS